MEKKYSINEFASLIRKKTEGQYDEWDDNTLVNKFVKKHPVYADWLGEPLDGGEKQVDTVRIPKVPDVSLDKSLDIGIKKSGLTIGSGVGFSGEMDFMQKDSKARDFSVMLTELEIPAETWENLPDEEKQRAVFEYARYKQSKDILSRYKREDKINLTPGHRTPQGLVPGGLPAPGRRIDDPGKRDMDRMNYDKERFEQEARGSFTKAVDVELTDEQKKIVDELGDHITLRELRQAEQVYQALPDVDRRLEQAQKAYDLVKGTGGDPAMKAMENLQQIKEEKETLQAHLNLMDPEVKEQIAEERKKAIERGKERGGAVGRFYEKLDKAAKKMQEEGSVPLLGVFPWDKATGLSMELISEFGKRFTGAALTQTAQNYYTGMALRESNPQKREYYLNKAHEYDEFLQGFEGKVTDVTKAVESPKDLALWTVGSVGQLIPVMGSFMLSGIAGGKVGGTLASPFGPQATAVGTVAGSMAGSFLAGYESYKSSIYWEIMRMGGTHDAAKELATVYAIPASAFSIAVPSFLSSAFLGAFGKRQVSNMLLARSRDILLTSLSESTGEMLAQESVMYAREVGSGVIQTAEERANERWNTFWMSMLMGPAGLMIPVQRNSSGKRPTAQELERHIGLYTKVNDKIQMPERPLLRKYMVEQLDKLNSSGRLDAEGRKVLNHLADTPISDAIADPSILVMDQISIGVMERTDAENLARLQNLHLKDKTEVLEFTEALELTSIMINKPQVYQQFQNDFIKESPVIQAYIVQRKAMTDVEMSRKVDPSMKARVDEIIKIPDPKERSLALLDIFNEMDVHQVNATKAYISNVLSYNNMSELIESHRVEVEQQVDADARESASMNAHTDGNIHWGVLNNTDGSRSNVFVLSQIEGADGGSYVVKDSATGAKKVVSKADVSNISVHTQQQVIDIYKDSNAQQIAEVDAQRKDAFQRLSSILRNMTPGTRIRFGGSEGYVYGVLNGELYMIPEGGTISNDGVQIPLDKLVDVEILVPPTEESTNFVNQEVEVIDTPSYSISELENAYNQIYEDSDAVYVNPNSPVTKDGVELQPIPEGSRSGKPFDGWLYDTAKMFLDGSPEGAALISQANRNKLSTFEREAMLEVLFGKGKIRLVEQEAAAQQETNIVESKVEAPEGEYLEFDMSSKKSASKEEATNMTRKDLNADIDGTVNLVHYSHRELETISPSNFGEQSHTTERRRMGGVSFYYQADATPESGVGNNAHIVRVPAEKIYPISKDPLNIIPKIRQSIKDYSKKYMEGVELGISPETIIEFSQEILSDMGYIGAYADWGYRDRLKRDTQAKRIELWEDQKVDKEYTSRRRRFMVMNPSPSNALQSIRGHIYNSIQNNLQRHPNKNEILPRFYTLEKQGIKAMVNDEIISQYISKDLIDEFNKWSAASDFSSVETSPLTNGPWAVISAWNPGSKRPGIEVNRAQNEKLISKIKEMGYEPVVQKGMYDTYEESVFIPGMSAQEAIQLGKEFGQESILSPEGLVYQDGTVNPGNISNIAFNQRADNFYSQIEIEGIPIKYQVPIDFDTTISLEEATQRTEQLRENIQDSVSQLDMSLESTKDFSGDQIKESIPNTKVVDIEGYPMMVEMSSESIGDATSMRFGDSGGDTNVFLNITKPLFNDPAMTHVTFDKLSERMGRNDAIELLMSVEDIIYESDAWSELVDEYGTLERLLESPGGDKLLIVDVADIFNSDAALELLKNKGYDGAIFQGSEMEASIEYRVFDSSQIIDPGTGKPISSDDISFAIAGENLISPESVTTLFFKDRLTPRTFAETVGKKPENVLEALDLIHKYENSRRRGINMSKPSDEMNQRVSEYITPILLEHLKRGGEDALGWYSYNIDVAMEAAAKLFPEIKTDKKAELVYKILLAITSPSATPQVNTAIANKIMPVWIKEGRFPEKGIKGLGFRKNTVMPNLIKINKLFDQMNTEEAISFLKTEQTPEAFAEAGWEVKSNPYGVNSSVPGGAIFGIKVGGEFLSSILGNQNWGTMDMWMSRFIEMFLGQRPKSHGSTAIKGSRAAIKALLKGVKDPWSIKMGDKTMTVRKPKGINTKTDILKNNENIDKYADNVYTAWSKTGFDNAFKSGQEVPGVTTDKGKPLFGSIVEFSRRNKAQRKRNEVPRDTGRKILQEAMRMSRYKVKELGYNLTVPDIQAVLWYYAKDVIENTGVRSEQAESYSGALINILKNERIDTSDIEAMLAKRKGEYIINSVAKDNSSSYFDMISKATGKDSDIETTMGRMHSEIVLLNMLSNETGKVVIARNSQELMNAMAEQGEPISAVNDVAEKAPIHFINGMFSKRTGVTYYNLEDMAITGKSPLAMFLHEQGVHYGIKKLIPDTAKRNVFLTRMFHELGGDKFISQAFPSKDVYDAYRKSLPDQAVAEEYLARIAEKITADELLSQPERTAWQKFIDLIIDFIEKVVDRQIRMSPKGAEKVALAAARTVIGEGKPTRLQNINELGDLLKVPDRSTIISPPGMNESFSDGLMMMSISDKKGAPKETKNHLEMVEELQAVLNQHKEKGKQMRRREVVEQFIRENRKELQTINPGRIPSSLNKVLKAARSNKSLDAAIAGLKNAIIEGQKTQARRMADDFARSLGKLKLEVKSGGIIRAKLLLQEGVDYVNSVKGILAMTKDEVTDAMAYVEKEIEGYEEVLLDKEGDAETLELISNAEAIYSLLEMYGDLRNKPLSHVQSAISGMKADMKQLREEFRSAREVERERRMERIHNIADDTGGDPVANKGFFEDVILQSDRTGPGWIQRYQAMHGTIASLTHAIWRGFKEGQRSKEFYNSNLFRLYKDVDNGVSAKIGMQEEMKKRVLETMKDITGMSERQFAKKMEEEHTITLDVRLKGEDNWAPKKVSLKLGNLIHLWLSYQSEANKGYMERIRLNNVMHRLNESTFDEITKIVAPEEGIMDFSMWLMRDFFGSKEYYNAVNEVVSRKLGRRLSSLTDYIPVVALGRKNSMEVDLNNFGVFKSIVKERRGGDYHLDKNNIWDTAMKYTHDVSSMVHLAEPVSEMYYTLNSFPVRAATKAMKTDHKVDAILELLKKGYTGQLDPGSFLYEKWMRRFRGTKILMNYSLVPKQITSLIAALDPDFGDPSAIAGEMAAFITGQGNKEIKKIVMQIARNAPDLKYRNMMDIESLTEKKGRKMPKIGIRMYGDKPSQMALGTLTTLLYNPTVVGDVVPIYVGGIPIAVHNYKKAMKEAPRLGLKGKDAEAYAAQKAIDMMTEFINTTQQSAKMTHRSQFQHGGYRAMAIFMNAIMGYSRKITRHTRDIGRDYTAGFERAIQNGDKPAVAAMKATASIPPSKLASLFIYTSVLPVLFSTVSDMGTNFSRMFSEDDEEKKKARWMMGFDATLGWTRGLFGIGFMLELGFQNALNINYGPRQDNILPIFDDAMDVMDGIFYSWRLVAKYNDETIKDRPEHEQKIYEAIAKTAIPLVGLGTGTSTVLLDRIYDVYINEGYDSMIKSAARLYGISDRNLQILFDGDPLSQIDPEVAEFYKEDSGKYEVGEYLKEMRARHEVQGKTFDERKYLNKFLAYMQVDAINDPGARLTVNVLLSNWGNEKKAQWFAARYDKYPGIKEFADEMINPFDQSLMRWSSNTDPGRSSNLPPIMTESLKEAIIERIAVNISRSKMSNEEKIEEINSLISGVMFKDKEYKQVIRLRERIKSLENEGN